MDKAGIGRGIDIVFLDAAHLARTEDGVPTLLKHIFVTYERTSFDW
jgi:hypothetical protein